VVVVVVVVVVVGGHPFQQGKRYRHS